MLKESERSQRGKGRGQPEAGSVQKNWGKETGQVSDPPERKTNEEGKWHGMGPLFLWMPFSVKTFSAELEGIAQVLVCKPWASCVLDLGAYLQHPHPPSRKSFLFGDPDVDLSSYENRFIASIWESRVLRSSGASHRPTCLVRVSIALRKQYDQK